MRSMQLHNDFAQLKKELVYLQEPHSWVSPMLPYPRWHPAPLIGLEQPTGFQLLVTLTKPQNQNQNRIHRFGLFLHFILSSLSSFELDQFEFWDLGGKFLKCRSSDTATPLRWSRITAFHFIHFVFNGLENAALLVQPQESS